LAGETEVLGENLPKCHFVNHKSDISIPGLEPGPPELWRGLDLIIVIIEIVENEL
jgi:hypothetical protein